MSFMNRRTFLTTSLGAAPLCGCALADRDRPDVQTRYAALDDAASKPVLKRGLFSTPVIIESVDLLHYRGNYIIRVRSGDGAVGYCVGHNLRMPHLYPIQLMLVNPFFMGKDARDLDRLMADILMYKNNYKYLGYTLLIPMATVEMAILDMLGRIAGNSMGELIGDIHNTEIAIYRANNNRGRSAAESIRRIKALQAETGASKFVFKFWGASTYEDAFVTIVDDPEGIRGKVLNSQVLSNALCRSSGTLYFEPKGLQNDVCVRFKMKLSSAVTPRLLKDKGGWFYLAEAYSYGTNLDRGTFPLYLVANRDQFNMGTKLRYKTASGSHKTMWSKTNDQFVFTTGQWHTVVIYLKKGNAGVGRFYVRVDDTVVFDITDEPMNWNNRDWKYLSFLKLYSSHRLHEYLRDRGDPVQAWYDDI